MTPDHRQAPIGPLTHPCDLDLLLYFRRYPRVLLTSEHLAAYTGYDLKQVGRSLETLIGAGVVTRSQSPTHEARLYVFATDSRAGWLAPLLAAASTPDGRATLLRFLGDGAGPTPDSGGGRSARADTEASHA